LGREEANMNNSTNNYSGLLHEVADYRLIKIGEGFLTVSGLVQLILMLGLVFVAEYLLRRYFVHRLLRRTRMDAAMQFAVARIIGYFVIVLGVYVALLLVGLNLSSLAVVAGALGVGIGFGLQNIVHNFVSGLIILAERPIAIGDRVEISGVAGQVKQIQLRSTTIETNDNITYIVPNSDFITSPVINWSHGDPRVRMRLPLGVAYGSDLEKLQRVLMEVALDHPKVLREPKPAVFFNGFGDSSLDFELAVWTAEMTFQPRRFRSELYFAMERKLRENQIEIPFPQRDLHLRSGAFVVPNPPGNGAEPKQRE
jgi:small-conductance mechanosensitive channel